MEAPGAHKNVSREKHGIVGEIAREGWERQGISAFFFGGKWIKIFPCKHNSVALFFYIVLTFHFFGMVDVTEFYMGKSLCNITC